jgi:hypothetical protein
MVYKNPIIITSFIIISLFSIGFSIQSIYGHTEIKVGNYTIEAGWSNEPPLINNLNEVVIFIFENDSPVRNAMKDLSVSINYGGINKKLNFLPSEESVGQYLADIIPSNLGTYSLNLKGIIGTQNINNDIQIEEVEYWKTNYSNNEGFVESNRGNKRTSQFHKTANTKNG